LSNVQWFEDSKVVLPKPILMNHHHQN
jgi:hypothetical protein